MYQISFPFLHLSWTNLRPQLHKDPAISTILGVFSGAIISGVRQRASGASPPDKVAKNMPLKALLTNTTVTFPAPATNPKLRKISGSCVRGNTGTNVHTGKVLEDTEDSAFDQHPTGLTLHIMVLTPKTTGWYERKRGSTVHHIIDNGWMVMVICTRDIGIFPNGVLPVILQGK